MSTGKTSWRETAKTVVLACLLAVGVRTAVAEPFHVPSESMLPTLAVGDFMFASKFAYGYSRHSLPLNVNLFSGRALERPAQRGDIVVFKLPRDPETAYVKRVVGLPGDRIRMVRGVLTINGEPVRLERVENHQGVPQFIETLPGGVRHRVLHAPVLGPLDDTAELVVPAGHYFMMGDNRSNSLDSRVPQDMGGVGFVPAENLIGRADLRHFSVDFDARWDNPAGWLKVLRLERIGWIS
ncbi:signal peptidase I [Azospirillum sp. sgz301742]